MKPLFCVISVFLFMLLSISAFPQLSGTYTIGGSSPNYTTFTAAVADLLNKGVSGPVTFNVRSGTYNEQIVITAVTGASATNTVTFQSETGIAANVTLQFSNTSSNNYVIELNGASYITIQNLTIASTEPTFNYGQVIYFQNTCNYDNILNNTLNGLPVTSWYTSADVIVAYCPGTGLRVEGNTITNGTESMIWLGTDNTPSGLMNCSVVKNNVMTNAYEWSMAIAYQNNSIMEGNTFTSNSPNLNLGMQIQDVVNPLLIIDNKFTYNNTFCVLYIVNNHPTDLNHSVIVANNFFSLGGNCTAMELINDDYSQFYYNSVYSNGSGQGFVDYGGSTGSVLANNIFYESAGGSAISIDPGDVSYCDYNDIYTTGTNFGTWNGTSVSNLAAWQTASGLDAHSKSIVPPFVSFADLHLTNYSTMRFGIPEAAIPDDKDGFLRGANPAVGAEDTGTIPYVRPATPCGPTKPDFTASPTSVCQGGTVNFTDQSSDNPTGWQWTFAGGTPSASNARNPVITYDSVGTFSVKLVVNISAGHDSVTKVGYITVNPLPVTGSVAASPDSLCPGSASQLTLTGSSGTIQWQSSMDGILFTNIPSGTSSAYSTPALTETTQYRVKVSNQCGTDSSKATAIVVIPLPVIGLTTITPDSVCSGDSATLNYSGNGNIQWQSSTTGNSFTGTGINNPSYHTPPLVQTTYYRAVVNNGMCADTSYTDTVTVRPSPVAPALGTADSLICSSDSTKITSSGSYAAYKWNNGDTRPYTYTSSAGAYWVTVTDANGCTAVSGRQDVKVYPVTSVSIIVQGDTLSSYNSSFYQWYFNDSPLPGDTSPVYVAQQSGEYAVQVVDTNGCKELSNNTPVTVLGLMEPARHTLNIYPDPFINTIFIKGDAQGGNMDYIKLYNALGEVLLSKNIEGTNANNISLDVSRLPVGSYYLKIKTGGVEYVRKMVKE